LDFSTIKNYIRQIVNIINHYFFFLFTVWAETGEFRESNHNTMSAVANMDHSQMNFQTPTPRNRRDRKNDGKSAKKKDFNGFILINKLLTYLPN